MFDRIKKLLLGGVGLGLLGCAHLPPETAAERPFSFSENRLGFANETVWNYVDGKPQPERDQRGKTGDRYARRCFVVCRAVVQFWKFARFDASLPALPEQELANQIRKIAKIDVWQEPLNSKERLVIPGYPNLRAASLAHPKTFQENMGLGWPVYFRLGNVPMVISPTTESQVKLHQEIQQDLAQGYPTILWLVNFPSLSINHAVVVFRQSTHGSITNYQVYDPNDAVAPHCLTYDAKKRQFSFEKTFYYPGGPVDARPLYRSLIQ